MANPAQPPVAPLCAPEPPCIVVKRRALAFVTAEMRRRSPPFTRTPGLPSAAFVGRPVDSDACVPTPRYRPASFFEASRC